MGSKKGVGLDIGTNMLVSAIMNDEGQVVYKRQRDAFFKIVPKSEVNRKSIKTALEGRKANFIIDNEGFVVVGEDALLMANERNLNARRPMSKGILSAKEKESLPMIKLIIKSLIGQGNGDTNLVFSIPADPIDSVFDIFYHTEMIKAYLKEMGFKSTAINEGFAIAFSELLNDNLTGMCLSFGAGMVNVTVIYEGDPIIQFAITKGGDWIDESVAKALDMSASMVQIEKEESIIDLLNPSGKIQEAISVYYGILISYALDNILYELDKKKLPRFSELPVILSGGLVLAENFTEKFNDELKCKKFPFKIKEVRKAVDPMNCVAHGCLMASILE
jgi:actin-like ATPase involved in cell morphogenesis